MAKQDLEQLLMKILTLLFASILTVMGWLATTEITSMALTLKEIRNDVSHLNSKALLQEQEFKFKFEWMQKELLGFNKRLLRFEEHKP